MKRKSLLIMITLLFASLIGTAQTQFWSDNFEDSGSPSVGSRTTSIAEYNCNTGAGPNKGYFRRTTTSEIEAGAFTSITGAKFWGAMNIDVGTTCTGGSVSPGQSITWSGINIAGKSGLSFKGFFGANSGATFQGLYFASAGQNYTMDSMAVEYRIDGGAWTKIIGIYPIDGTTASSSVMALDNNNNRIGDGTPLTFALAEISAGITGTGSTLDLRFDIFDNNSSPGSMAIDNFRLFETATCVAPTVTSNPPNRTICAGANTTFSCAATGATAYQWQVNTGSGFVDISNTGVYTNATTNTLTITGATAGMSGYTYRCKTMNGVATCVTNTGSGTLTVSSVAISGSQNNNTCYGGTSGSATATASGGIAPYTYTWTPNVGATASVSNLAAGSYSVVVTDNISCTASNSYVITQGPIINSSVTSQTNVSCNNGSNGAATITASGGTGTLTYNWTPGNPSGDGTTSVTGLTAGTWTCTITDANGCTKTQNVIISEPGAITSSVTSQTNVACNNGSNGAATITAAGGTGTLTYNWTPGNPSGDGTTSVTGLTAGTWTCTITDANGCTKTQTVDITAPSAITSSLTSQTNVACNNGSNGAATITASGGTGTLTYNWTPGNPSGDGTTSVTGLTAGTWTCTITDANGCTKTQTVDITAPAAITSSVTSQTNVSCNNGSNGAATITASGGTGTLTYNWTPGNPSGDGTTSVTGLTAGTWTCTITDANSCTKTQTVIISEPGAITSSLTSQTNVSCNNGSNGAATITAAGGTGTLTYNWTPGNPSGDGTTSVTGLTAGTWTCTITDANGCTKTQNVIISEPGAITSSVTSQTNVACNNGSNGAATITASGGTGTLTYNWTPGNPSGDGTTSVTGLTAGTWTCTITDANGCTKTQNVIISEPGAITSSVTSQTNVACNNGSNGAATITAAGGTGTLTYNWTPGNPSGDGTTSVTGLTAGTWTCTITDANGCTKTQTVDITAPSAITSSLTSQTNVACNNGSNGAATITAAGGTGTLTYNWTPGNPSGDGTTSVTGLTAGTWTCTITDANSCTKTQTVIITEPGAITSSLTSQTNVSCNNGSNGAATITAAGGTGTLTYNWTPGNPSGDGTTSVTGLTAGTWTCTITDANSCTKTQTVIITEPAAITSSVTSQTNVACNNGSNGAATITASGGTGTLTYNWTPGNPSGDGTTSVTGLTAGTWTCTITDANSCTKTQTVIITEPGAITSSVTSQTNVACNNGSNGAATITASGGTGTLTYNWTPGNPSGDGTTSVTGLTAGTWTCTITDANSCTKTQTVIITEPGAITSSLTSQTNVACNNGSNGAATITAAGGTGTLTYNWTPGNPSGDGTTSVTGLTAGTWTCTITDANGCTKTQNVIISEPGAITSSVTSQTNVACNNGSNGAATITAAGGTGTLTYNWTPGNPSGDGTTSVTGLTAGTWTCTITDANGCTKTQNVIISEPGAITSSVTSQTNVACNNGSNGAATITAAGGTGTLTYNWTPGNPSGDGTTSVTGLTAGTWTCTITDANGCTKTQTVDITAPSAITSSVTSQTNVACNNGSNGAATITASGGTGTLTYNWTPGNPSGDGTTSVTGLTAGTWTCTITDANSCTKTQTVIITEPGAITSSVTSQTNVACNNGSNGAATITAAGGTGTLTYNWTPGNPSGDGTTSVTGLTAGTWTCTITDANSCTKTQTVIITEPGAITSSLTSQTNVACNNGSNGAATITAAGGTGTLTYNWTPGNPSGDGTTSVTGLTAGTWTCTITDANGCTKTQNVIISEPGAITSSVTSQTNVACNNGSNGAATITAAGGTGTLTYNWTPGNPSGDGTTSVTGLTAGTWTCTITDANGCTKTQNVIISEPGAITSSVTSQTNVACNNGSNGAATITAAGGTGTLTYNWTPGNPSGDGTASVTGLIAGTWTCTITDANGCTKTQQVVITEPNALTLVASNDTNSCSGTNVSLNAVAGSGTPGYSYNWTPGNLSGASQTVNPVVTTNYVVTATDANGCTKKDTVIVSVGGVLAQSNQTNSISIDGADTSSSNVLIGNFNFMYNEDCKIVASVRNNAALGALTGYVTVVDTVPVFANRPFVPRWYQITPQNNLPASVNLYFTQQDFDEFNVYANSHGMPKLPQSPSDQAGIDTLVITKVSNGDFYTGTYTLIHPDSVKWNASLHYWTVSLSVPSFSMFLVHSNVNNTPLEVSMKSFVAAKEKNTVGLYWTTESERNNIGFGIERSNDGKQFTAIGKVYTKAVDGNSHATLNYNFTDKAPLAGMNFYRLAQEDRDGAVTYSDVRTVNFDNQTVFNCYPNPTEGQLVVEQTAPSDNQVTVRFTDVLGKIVLEKHVNVIKGFNKNQIDMSVLAQGMYNMTILDNSGIIYHTRVTKK